MASATLVFALGPAGSAVAFPAEPKIEVWLGDDTTLGDRCNGAVDVNCRYCSYNWGAFDYPGYCAAGFPGYKWPTSCRAYVGFVTPVGGIAGVCVVG